MHPRGFGFSPALPSACTATHTRKRLPVMGNKLNTSLPPSIFRTKLLIYVYASYINILSSLSRTFYFSPQVAMYTVFINWLTCNMIEEEV